MGKRKLDVVSSHATKKRSVFRLVPLPSARATSASTVTMLRKGSHGRRGCRKEQLPESRPGSSIEQGLPSNETFSDPPLPHLDELDNFTQFAPKAEKPKRDRKNTIFVSVLLRIYLNVKLIISRQTFLSGLTFDNTL